MMRQGSLIADIGRGGKANLAFSGLKPEIRQRDCGYEFPRDGGCAARAWLALFPLI